MKLIAQVQLKPTVEQKTALKVTLQRANEACNYISEQAWKDKTFGQFALHKLTYYAVKEKFGLSAQVVVRLIAKVSDAYDLDRRRFRTFKPYGSIAYDDRILRWKVAKQCVSIWTLEGRQEIPFVCGSRQLKMLADRQGETDLVLCDDKWYLLATCNLVEPPPREAKDFLGIDLGIKNIAATSDGKLLSGAKVNSLRKRYARIRGRLQSKGTKSAKRLLKARRRKEARFVKDINHCISKKIVATAQDTGRGIAVENLNGIRSRVTVRKPQRAMIHGWSFAQLRSFLEYKARQAGIPVVAVDPSYTSQTCPKCGHISKSNRPSRDIFKCKSCGFSGPSDCIAAENIRRIAVNQSDAGKPIAA